MVWWSCRSVKEPCHCYLAVPLLHCCGVLLRHLPVWLGSLWVTWQELWNGKQERGIKQAEEKAGRLCVLWLLCVSVVRISCTLKEAGSLKIVCLSLLKAVLGVHQYYQTSKWTSVFVFSHCALGCSSGMLRLSSLWELSYPDAGERGRCGWRVL